MGSSRKKELCRGGVTRWGFVGRLATGAVAAGLPFLSPACSSPGTDRRGEPGDGAGAQRPNILTLVDEQIGRVLAALERRGLLEKTLSFSPATMGT